jgi:hypothetical protein
MRWQTFVKQGWREKVQRAKLGTHMAIRHGVKTGKTVVRVQVIQHILCHHSSSF